MMKGCTPRYIVSRTKAAVIAWRKVQRDQAEYERQIDSVNRWARDLREVAELRLTAHEYGFHLVKRAIKK